MLFLKFILDENEQSMVGNFFKLQIDQPVKGDWVSTVRKNLKEMNIGLTWNEIRMMSKDSFLKVIKTKISEISLKYLLNKRCSKGKEIEYESLEMGVYLKPFNQNLTIEEKRKVFSVRNRMIKIGNNVGKVKNA